MTRPEPLFRRDAANPILTAADVPYPANSVFNPGAARVDGETILLVRVEDLRGISQLHVARSQDGVTDWRFDAEPLLQADVDRDPEETWGCEDPRLTWLPEREEWAIAYTAYSRRGPLVSLATTRDFRTVRRLGPVMPPGGQGRRAVPAPVRRSLGDDPPPVAAPRRRPHVALVLAGPAPLGRPHAAARGARRRLVGRRQDRPRAAAARDAPRAGS